MYTVVDYPSKAELKREVAKGVKVKCYSPGAFPCPENGTIHLEGPHYPKPHSWYAQATVKDSIIVKGSIT